VQHALPKTVGLRTLGGCNMGNLLKQRINVLRGKLVTTPTVETQAASGFTLNKHVSQPLAVTTSSSPAQPISAKNQSRTGPWTNGGMITCSRMKAKKGA
jgi:hypothetical protein